MHEVLIYNQTKAQVPKKFISDIILKALQFLKLKQPMGLAVLIVGPEEIRRLNKNWRKIDRATDELSFGLNSRLKADYVSSDKKFAKNKNKMLELGEIVINVACLPVGKDKISDKSNFVKVLVHGLLHLLDYDHEKSKAEALKMERLERKIFKFLINI